MSDKTYIHKTYAKGFAINVTPGDRCADVLHYLMFGTFLGGRSLEGVTWEEVEQSSKATKALSLSMKQNMDKNGN